jgi:hypothetical protein
MHDNGFVELAVLQGKAFTSALITRYIGYNLANQNSFLDVSVIRIFDEIQVYVEGALAFSFQTQPKAATVSLSSEQSTSKFTDIDVQTRNILSLFATRQFSAKPVFHVQEEGSEELSLVVSNDSPEFVIVSQYLYTKLRKIANGIPNNEVRANLFFQGWVANTTGLDSEKKLIVVGIEGMEVAIGLTFFSIISTYLLLIFAVMYTWKRYSALSKLGSRLKREEIQLETEANE